MSEALSRKEHGGKQKVCFLDKKGRQCEIPLSWTDLAPEDAVATLAAGKSWFRAADLLELARLVAAFGQWLQTRFVRVHVKLIGSRRATVNEYLDTAWTSLVARCWWRW